MHGSQSFPKSQHLLRPSQFQRVYDNGRRYHGSLAVAHVLPAPDQPRVIGIVTSRKVGNAVARNRARRLIREAYRLNQHQLQDHFQIVMVSRNSINGKKRHDVEVCLRDLFRSAGLLCEA